MKKDPPFHWHEIAIHYRNVDEINANAMSMAMRIEQVFVARGLYYARYTSGTECVQRIKLNSRRSASEIKSVLAKWKTAPVMTYTVTKLDSGSDVHAAMFQVAKRMAIDHHFKDETLIDAVHWLMNMCKHNYMSEGVMYLRMNSAILNILSSALAASQAAKAPAKPSSKKLKKAADAVRRKMSNRRVNGKVISTRE